MKQIQFGAFRVYGDADMNSQVRAGIEGPLNNGWDLNSWEVANVGLDENNQMAYTVVVCLTRETVDEVPTLVEEEASKRGRPAKVDA